MNENIIWFIWKLYIFYFDHMYYFL